MENYAVLIKLCQNHGYKKKVKNILFKILLQIPNKKSKLIKNQFYNKITDQ
jgi:hypothetical protein